MGGTIVQMLLHGLGNFACAQGVFNACSILQLHYDFKQYREVHSENVSNTDIFTKKIQFTLIEV